MNPEYIGMLTLMVEPGTPLYDWVHDGSFRLLDQHQVLKETELLVSHFDSPGRGVPMNHASNYLDLRGTLNQDRDALLAKIHQAEQDLSCLRPEKLARTVIRSGAIPILSSDKNRLVGFC